MSIKISAFSSASLPLSGAELILMNQNGSTKTTILSNIKSYVGNTNVSTLSSNWQNTYTTFSSTSSTYALKNVNNTFTVGQSVAGPLSATSIYISPNVQITSSSNNVKIGDGSLPSGVSNFFACVGSGNNNVTGNNNIFMGVNSGVSNTSGSNNNFIGVGAGVSSNTARSNNFIGVNSGVEITTGSYNTMVGEDTGALSNAFPNLSSCIVIGAGAKVNASNQLSIGSTSYPISTSATGVLAGLFLNVRINGINYKLQLYS
jgi:trimeric autotransporter adhesin